MTLLVKPGSRGPNFSQRDALRMKTSRRLFHTLTQYRDRRIEAAQEQQSDEVDEDEEWMRSH